MKILDVLLLVLNRAEEGGDEDVVDAWNDEKQVDLKEVEDEEGEDNDDVVRPMEIQRNVSRRIRDVYKS